jgi:DNA repair protein RadD
MAQQNPSVSPDFEAITRIQERAIAETMAAVALCRQRRDWGVANNYAPLADQALAVLVEAPTGAGKTRISARNFEELSKAFEAEHGRKPVILALQHREMLLDNAQEALGRWAPESGLKSSRAVEGKLDTSGDVIYGMVQTVAANLGRLPKIDILAIDEAHHASDSDGADYTKVINHTREQNPDMVLLATTATPNRPDKKSLNPALRDAERVTIGYKELEEAGQILLPSTKVVTIHREDGTTTNQLMRSKFKPEKDADPAGLTKALRAARPADFHDQMLDAWERDFKEPLAREGIQAGTIVYEGTIAAARKFADMAKERGHAVAVMDSDQDKALNAKALEDYAGGKVDMVVSVKMLDEGVDVPRTRCAMILRETTSDIEYSQMVGRTMRMGSDPVLQGVRPRIIDGGASTMIHGSVERRAEVIDYYQKLARGEPAEYRLPDADRVPSMGEKYSPWKVLKNPPPIMATTDGRANLYAVASAAPDGGMRYSILEAVTIKGKSQVTILKGNDKRPLIAIDAQRLRALEAERLLPSRHSLMRLEATESALHGGRSLLDDKLAERPEYVASVEKMSLAMLASRSAGR